MPPSPLRRIVDILSSAVQVIDDRYAAANLDFPALDHPYDPTSEAEQLLTSDPHVTEAVALIMAATGQLSAFVEFPALAIFNAALSFHITSCLAIASSTNVVEILREAGTNGLHVSSIAEKNNSHPTKTASVLRLLATHNIFREVSPGVFANNRLSSILDTLKTSDEIFAKPHEKHQLTSGVAAFVENANDTAFKAAPYLVHTFTDPRLSLSEENTETAFNFGFGTDLNYWAWFEKPENSFRRDRFGVAMNGTRKLEISQAILKGFDWSSLPQGGVVVDVGGGIGSTVMSVAERYPDLKVVLQDFPRVIEKAREHWNALLPRAVSSGSITFCGHDFFQPQPVMNASVFLLRGVMHDWNDKQALIILRHLRDVANPGTQLLIVDQVLRYACIDTTPANSILGAQRPSPPAPLLANYGMNNRLTYLFDLQMLTLFNARERPLSEFVDLTAAAGWNVVRVFHIPGSLLSQILAVPGSSR